jgi:hypothetical protein
LRVRRWLRMVAPVFQTSRRRMHRRLARRLPAQTRPVNTRRRFDEPDGMRRARNCARRSM